MIQGIADNAGTIVVSLLLIAVVAWILAGLYKDKKRGKSSCGSSCGCCPMAGSCHRKT